jgi:hypothetical protein
MVTVNFKREFVKGTLKGIIHSDKIDFVSMARAESWIMGIDANSRKLDYIIFDIKFSKKSQ